MVRPVLLASLAFALAACSEPKAPDKEQPPEPQAAHAASRTGDLARAVQRPIHRARQAQAAIDASAISRRSALAVAEDGATP